MTPTIARILPSLLEAHRNIGLQFSGGKDSLAVAHLLRPHWDRVTFYHVDTGDLLPEVREIVDGIAAEVPNFRRIQTDIARWIAAVGLPSDLVPTSSTAAGLAIGASSQRIVDRFDCCASNIMAPMHQRMVADGVTLVIRGTKRADMARLPHEGGHTPDYYIWLPLKEWSDADVFGYLRSVGAPICRVYENGAQSPECATCPAWWSEKRGAYLRQHHPDLFATYRARLATVSREIAPHVRALQMEAADA